MPERIAATDPKKSFTEVIGSGPYRFLPDEFVSGSRVVYAKFDGYVPRPGAAGVGHGRQDRPFPRGSSGTSSPTRPPPSAALQQRRGRLVGAAAERPAADAAGATPACRPMIQDPTGRMALMRLNHLQPPFNDVRIRRAVLMSVDQEEYMRAANGDDPALWKVCPSIYPCDTPYAVRRRGQAADARRPRCGAAHAEGGRATPGRASSSSTRPTIRRSARSARSPRTGCSGSA